MMYLANATGAFPGGGGGVFQRNNLLAANAGLFLPAEQPQTALQKISDRIIDKQANAEQLEALSRAAQLRKDTYVETDAASSLEEAPDDLLKMCLHVFKIHEIYSENYAQELADFKTQLQEWDKTLQEYQEILDGKVPLQEGQTMEAVLLSYTQAKQDRTKFFEDGIAHLNESYGYSEFMSDQTVDRFMQRVMGRNNIAGKDPSVWKIDPSAADISAEIDRVLSEVHGVTAEFRQGIDRLCDLLQERGEEEKYQSYRNSWTDPANSYFERDRTIQQMTIEWLKSGPLQKL